jgi:hypothetical protein
MWLLGFVGLEHGDSLLQQLLDHLYGSSMLIQCFRLLHLLLLLLQSKSNWWCTLQDTTNGAQ